jgi:hypothetical protein
MIRKQTNYKDEIIERYTNTTWERIIEGCNVIMFPNVKSLRK